MENAPTSLAQPPAEQPPAESPKPAFTHRRNGFVARKPKQVRDQINLMLLDGFTYRKIIDALGEDAKDLNEDHMGSWANGGYKEWYARLERNEDLRFSREAALDLLSEKAATPVQDAGRTIATAQLYELIQSFDPHALAAALETKPELYLRILSVLARLSEGDALCAHRRALESLAQTKLKNDDKPSDKLILSKDALEDIARQIKLL